jgi:hypothetical protein
MVIPSFTEGLPNIMLEAMACGTPVLATPVGAISDIIRDSETGFIMENNSPKCIIENVNRVIGSSELETKEFDFKDFTAIEFGTALNVTFRDSDTFKVNISQSDSYRVSITANQNLFDYLVVTDNGGTLRIDLKSFQRYYRVMLEAQVTMPAISGLQLSGASRGDHVYPQRGTAEPVSRADA